jgi:transcriptional regulator of acetoin/glycerol metabolism
MTDEERLLRKALTEAEGSPTKAALLLGVTRMTVHRRMKKYGVEIKRVIERAA